MSKKMRHCDGKVKHKSKENACIAAKKISRVAMDVYKCPSCKFWHIGKTRSHARRTERITELLNRHEAQLKKRMGDTI